MTEQPRPVRHLSAYSERYPQAWHHLEDMRSSRGQALPHWEAWCFVPLAAAYAIVSGGGDDRVPLERAGDVSALAALAAWRMTKGIYRFDPDIAAELWRTPVTGDVPAGVLTRLPEWCVYLETPGRTVMDTPLHGFFAHLESDPSGGRRELRLLLDADTGLSPAPIHLVGTLRAGLDQMVHVAERQATALGTGMSALSARVGYGPEYGRRWVEELEPLISLVLYLCTDERDIMGSGGGEAQPQNPEPKRTKKGPRLFAAPGPRIWNVAVRLGAAYRQARARTAGERGDGGERSALRPHVRAAHYHTYWTGPRSRPEARRSFVKWLPPIPVAFEDHTEHGALPAVVHKVRHS